MRLFICIIYDNLHFYSKAVAITVVAYDGISYSTWYDMYDETDPDWFPQENCNNGIDDDNDGKTDCGDKDCYKAKLSVVQHAVCGKDPTVNHSQRNSEYPYNIYCSQGEDYSNKLTYGRCCPSGDAWDPDNQICVEHASCKYCNEVPFSTDWWENENCTRVDNNKITGTCHPTDFFGDDAYHYFNIRII